VRHGRYAYRELRKELIRLLLSGHVEEGEALPPVRTLAKRHDLNPLTVGKAIHTLPPGILRLVPGVGMFVAAGGVERLRAFERASFLQDQWPAIADEIRRLQLTRCELLQTTAVAAGDARTPDPVDA